MAFIHLLCSFLFFCPPYTSSKEECILLTSLSPGEVKIWSRKWYQAVIPPRYLSHQSLFLENGLVFVAYLLAERCYELHPPLCVSLVAAKRELLPATYHGKLKRLTKISPEGKKIFLSSFVFPPSLFLLFILSGHFSSTLVFLLFHSACVLFLGGSPSIPRCRLDRHQSTVCLIWHCCFSSSKHNPCFGENMNLLMLGILHRLANGNRLSLVIVLSLPFWVRYQSVCFQFSFPKGDW